MLPVQAFQLLVLVGQTAPALLLSITWLLYSLGKDHAAAPEA
jgi:hypothetical protein